MTSTRTDNRGRHAARSGGPALASRQRLRRLITGCISILLVVGVVALLGGLGRNGGPFVAWNSSSLTLGGKPFRFVGINIYNAASNGVCVRSTDFERDLETLGSQPKVVRVWFLQSWATSGSQREWTLMDRVVAAARAHGDRLVLVLANEWSYCDGAQKDLAWFNRGYQSEVQRGETVPYSSWVDSVVKRYANQPAVLMWELVNEPSATDGDGQCDEEKASSALRSFSDRMGALVHGIDSHHPVIMGAVAGECGTAGNDYQFVYGSPGTDLCDYHDYGFPSSPLGNTGSQDGFQATLDRCDADHKALVVLENGIHWTQVGSDPLARREALFADKIRAQIADGAQGELLWDYSDSPDQTYPGDYDLGPADPSLGLLRTW